MGTFDRIAPLPVLIDDVAYERTSQTVSSGFERVSTTIVMRGGGHEGRGEDICYTPTDHDLLPAPETLELAGSHTHRDALSQQLDGRALFTGEPGMPASLDYRRWAFESAALDLALRQAGATLGEIAGREAAPLRFVVSTRMDVRDWLAVAPGLEFKVDPIPGEWDVAHMDALAATGRVRVCDLKAHYHGTPVDTVPDADFHRLIAEHFPDAVLEDASLDADVLAALAGDLDRLSFDAPIHSLADVDALPMRDRAPQHQAVALRDAVSPVRVHRRLPRARHRALRRWAVRARRRAGPGAGDREPLLSRHAERRRAARLQRARAGGRPAAEPALPAPAPRGIRLVIAVALAVAALVAAPPKPPIVQQPIPYGAQRRAEMAAYSKRHYGTAQWRLIAPKVIVEHYTAATRSRARTTPFAPDHPDAELHELPNVCAHFVIDTDGTIYQLVPLTIRCRHTVGLNYTAIGIEHVGRSATGILSNARQIAASLELTRWLMARFHIAQRNVIGHAESLSSPYHHDSSPALRTQTHGDWNAHEMLRYRALLQRS